eukprot:m.257408 g.257408  ORF g.257408 m.257408 type:complete len:154 (+) comp24898_c0_seq1:361-822(+)
MPPKRDPYSVVDRLKSRGGAATFEERKQLYQDLGRTDEYRGTASQNDDLRRHVAHPSLRASQTTVCTRDFSSCYVGDRQVRPDMTAHAQLRDELIGSGEQSALQEFRGGAIRSDGLIAFNSGTLNGYGSSRTLQGAEREAMRSMMYRGNARQK